MTPQNLYSFFISLKLGQSFKQIEGMGNKK